MQRMPFDEPSIAEEVNFIQYGTHPLLDNGRNL
jgi:hypothetical protein